LRHEKSGTGEIGDEALVLYEKVLEVRSRVFGDEDPLNVTAMHNVSVTQYNLRLDEASHESASRGLRVARKIGDEEIASRFVDLLSKLAERKEDADTNASDEQKRIRQKIRDRKQQAKEKTAAEAGKVAAPQKPTTAEDWTIS